MSLAFFTDYTVFGRLLLCLHCLHMFACLMILFEDRSIKYTEEFSMQCWIIILVIVLKFASPVACTYGKHCVTNLKHGVFFDCLPYEWRSGTSDDLFLPIYPPRSMRVVLGFWWLVDFCNKYVSSLWLMLRPGIIRTLTLPSLLASSVPCIALSHLESWRILRRCIQILGTIHSVIISLIISFLKTATIPTY